jgi:excisionase family DNA binding protein
MSTPMTNRFNHDGQINRVEPMLISVNQVAVMLGVSTRTVWRLVSAGQLVAPVRLGGSARWRIDEVRRWIDDGCGSRSTKSAMGGPEARPDSPFG